MNSGANRPLRSIAKFCLYAVIDLMMPIILLGLAVVWVALGLPISGLHLVILVPLFIALAAVFVTRRRAGRHG